MKVRNIYICKKCNHQSPKWIGKCPTCNAWNSFEKEIIERKAKGLNNQIKAKPAHPVPLSIQKKDFKKIPSNINEVDRVLGGGIVQGNLILLSGEPGIGKSTLTLQLCDAFSKNLPKILYISGEESVNQISLRAQRLKTAPENLKLLNETEFETILATIEIEKPNLLIIDSVQVLSLKSAEGNAGSVSQVKLCTEGLMHFAKKTQTPVILIGHVTKEGNLAGPKVLEHLVDTVLHLEGDRYQNLRILRCNKNRFGSTNEIGVFSMEERGLIEVKNPSASFLEGKMENAIGSCITCTLEGTRPILVEIQALTNTTSFGYPKRTASGFDLNRLNLLAAVLQKHIGLNLQNQDIYVNVIGGLKIDEPAADLAVCLAILSSMQKIPLKDLVSIGEIGLSGEIRQVPQLKRRIHESKKMGFKSILSSDLKTLKQAINKISNG